MNIHYTYIDYEMIYIVHILTSEIQLYMYNSVNFSNKPTTMLEVIVFVTKLKYFCVSEIHEIKNISISIYLSLNLNRAIDILFAKHFSMRFLFSHRIIYSSMSLVDEKITQRVQSEQEFIKF